MLVFASALQDPGSFCYDELETGALAAGAAMRAGIMFCQAMATHAAGLASDGHALLLTLLALPHPALLGVGWNLCGCHDWRCYASGRGSFRGALG